MFRTQVRLSSVANLVLNVSVDDRERASHRGVIEMKVLCAWCCRDGQPGYLGERDPLDNPEPTHGICARHKAQLLDSLPSRSFPDAELLIVVPREDVALYEQLKLVFATLSRVQVVLDRRVADRRAESHPDSGERRMGGRRIHEGTTSPLTIVRFTPRGLPAPELPEVS